MTGAALLSLSQSTVLADLRAFLLNFLPAGIEVIQSQDNRVPEPTIVDFVIMTPTRRGRLATNRDSFADCTFQGSITANVLTVSGIDGVITLGALVFGESLPVAGVKVVAQLSGTALGNGTYSVPAGTANATADLMANGVSKSLQETQFSVQLDVHGPQSADMSQIITTLFRDEVATSFFSALGHGVSPLYADEARQMPFINEEQQVENRWVISAEMQIDPVVTVPQQFADTLVVDLVEVDTTFPAS